MKAKNMVVAGDYKGKPIVTALGTTQIKVGFFKNLVLTDKVVESYELVTDEHAKSAASGVARGLIGGALLGPVGMLAGGLSAKNKGVYTVAVEFKDGKKSLLEVDDKGYKGIVQSCFG